MRSPGFAVAATAVIGFAVLAAGWVALTHHLDPTAPGPVASGPSVSANGITLTSASITLPEEKTPFPAGAAGELITQHCAACHSPEMILNQPMLGAEKWKATVEKMRAAYHAPIAPGDDAPLIAALVSLQTPATAKP